MEDYLIEGELLTDIADKIREKAPDTYGENTIPPEEMPEAVEEVWKAGYSMGGGAVDLSPYQTKHDENLNTKSKEIVGAINEINAKLGGGGSSAECSLPTCDTSNNDQFLRVVNGVPAWTTVPNAEDNTF